MKWIMGLMIILLTASASMAGELTGSIRQFFVNKPSNSHYVIDKEYLLPGNMLLMFYFNRMYTPAWTNRNAPAWNFQNTPAWMNQCVPAWNFRNVVGKNAYDLLDYIRKADQHGLHPKDFHLALIDKYMGKTMSIVPMDTIDNEDKIILEILLTDAYLSLGTQLYYGKVDPAIEGSDWKMQRKDPLLRFDIKLEEALATNDLTNSLDQLAPKYHSYLMMKNELAFYLNLKKQSWPAILSDTSIKPGDSNRLIPEIRERLIKLRYPLSGNTSMIYDEGLEKQLKLFQNDWGLNSDSIIDKGILDVINSKPEKLINKLKVNMERFRWLPLQVTEKYIIVNIANYELDLIEGTDTLISLRAIVGKNYRKTPVFNERMTHIVFSPNWTVPPTILQNDVIPELLKGPAYLKKKNMHLLREDGSEIAYSDIDWSKISKNRFPYTVRQDPGPGNSLGRVKFMFPNIYNIYIHDTPSRGSFANNDRALSSGCIRVEKPYELAVLLLADMPEWSPSRILNAMLQDKEQKVTLKTPVDVVLIYLTAWTDGNSRVQFRKDVYQRDENVLKALNKKPEAAKF